MPALQMGKHSRRAVGHDGRNVNLRALTTANDLDSPVELEPCQGGFQTWSAQPGQHDHFGKQRLTMPPAYLREALQ
jgi:hypothetical protein